MYKDIFQEVNETMETEEELQRLTDNLETDKPGTKRTRSQEDLNQSQWSQRLRQTPHPRGRTKDQSTPQGQITHQTKEGSSSSSSSSDEGDEDDEGDKSYDPDADQDEQQQEIPDQEMDQDDENQEDHPMNSTPASTSGLLDQGMVVHETPPCKNSRTRPYETNHSQTVPETPQPYTNTPGQQPCKTIQPIPPYQDKRTNQQKKLVI